jgi:hypothetical protein
MGKPRQRWLRAVPDSGRDFSLEACNATSFTAASPLGVLVLPCSMSQTAEVERPISTPISASVRSHLSRRSVMRDAHVLMQPSLRSGVNSSQRQNVTGFRENGGMPVPPDMPNDLDSPGKRCKWWRRYRQRTEDKSAFQQGNFAKTVKLSQGALSDFENGHSDATESLHLICARLRLNPYYVDTGKGEPEAAFPQEPPREPDQWPFKSVSLKRVTKLNSIELHYAESSLLSALQEIERSRKSNAG